MSTLKNKKTTDDDIMLLIAERLVHIMKERKVETRDLVNATGISTTLVNMMRRGEGNPSISNLLKIARFFGKPLSYFVEPEIESVAEDSTIRQIKVFDLNSYGFNSSALYVMTLKKEKCENADFAIRVQDSTMEPIFSEGTIFLIKSSNEAQNGDTILLRLNGKNLIRKMSYMGEKVYFTSLDIKSKVEELNDYTILGSVTSIISGK